jgi:PIN domain nuclease of toxin-antitoxin system
VKLLLDTHALLWWATRDAELSRKAKKAIADDDNEVTRRHRSTASGCRARPRRRRSS